MRYNSTEGRAQEGVLSSMFVEKNCFCLDNLDRLGRFYIGRITAGQGVDDEKAGFCDFIVRGAFV